MKILIIRHGDPYYPTDSLTEKGSKEAFYLGEKLKGDNITNIYVSPLGRARLTAKPTAENLGLEPVVLDWLCEFPEMLNFEYSTDNFKDMKSPWNMPPKLWCDDSKIYNIDRWKQSDLLKGSKIAERYDYVCREFDALLKKHGYSRNGQYYNIETENTEKTIAFFCHFGLGTALIAHLLNMPLVAAWNSIFLPPSSVTTLYMERHIRDDNIAHGIFCGIGDTSHLYANNEPISCSGLHTRELK